MSLSAIEGIDYGFLNVQTGNMYSGKTEGLIRIVKEIGRKMEYGEKFRQLSIGSFKHSIDTRYSEENITSHSGQSIPAKPVSSVNEIVESVIENDYRVVAIDEIQFFIEKDENGGYLIKNAIQQFIKDKRHVIVAGLDMDFKGEPFGPMGDLLAICDDCDKYKSVCVKCGSPANIPQRLIDEKPAYYDDPVILPGANDFYEPRCRTCHEVNYRKNAQKHKNSNLMKKNA